MKYVSCETLMLLRCCSVQLAPGSGEGPYREQHRQLHHRNQDYHADRQSHHSSGDLPTVKQLMSCVSLVQPFSVCKQMLYLTENASSRVIQRRSQDLPDYRAVSFNSFV
jgi:hypothetical protein